MNKKVTEHKALCDMLNTVYEQKQNAYGDRFGESYKEFGAIAPIVRIDDKVNRLKQLLVHNADQKVKDEPAWDTCLDAANYLIMLAIELKRGESDGL